MQVSNLNVSYADKLVLRDIHLTIPEKRITGIVGPSGCGKSTFLLCLNRLIDEVPNAKYHGSIKLAGQSILQSGHDLHSLRRQVGLIFQKPNPFPISILRNLLLPMKEHLDGSQEELEARAQHYLKLVGLWNEVKDRLKETALHLSGGQQQRLCIARALVLEPEILLFDEPCSALDPIASGIVEDLIQELGRRYTVVIVTHNLAQARRICDDVAFFWYRDGAGELIESGPKQQLFEAPEKHLTRAYFAGVRG